MIRQMLIMSWLSFVRGIVGGTLLEGAPEQVVGQSFVCVGHARIVGELVDFDDDRTSRGLDAIHPIELKAKELAAAAP
jgi:hypothetical protein